MLSPLTTPVSACRLRGTISPLRSTATLRPTRPSAASSCAIVQGDTAIDRPFRRMLITALCSAYRPSRNSIAGDVGAGSGLRMGIERVTGARHRATPGMIDQARRSGRSHQRATRLIRDPLARVRAALHLWVIDETLFRVIELVAMCRSQNIAIENRAKIE